MRVLTVRQPYAWAIMEAGKDVENRRQSWHYRGLLAIHAGREWAAQSDHDPMMQAVLGTDDEHVLMLGSVSPVDMVWHTGTIIGVVDLDDVHTAVPGCCTSPWGEQDPERRLIHLCVSNPRSLSAPIPASGARGLWEPDDELTAAIHMGLAA